MITTVTLNPAIDYAVDADNFEKGRINRCKAGSFRPGGKGINVSLLLSSLGKKTTALGVAAGFTGGEIVRRLEEAGCGADFLFLPGGCSRINLKIRSREDGGTVETDLNGGGPEIPESALEDLGEKLSSLGEGDALVLAGSLPASLPPDAYARLLDRVAGKGVLTVVDTAGEALLCALSRRPFLIKPNLEELGELFGVELRDRDAAGEYARLLQEKGARNVLVSMGDQGALLVCEDGRRLFCRAVKGETVSTVGAGDSLVAGFLYGLDLHGTLEGALAWGTAAGAATAFTQGIASGEQVKALYPQVRAAHQI